VKDRKRAEVDGSLMLVYVASFYSHGNRREFYYTNVFRLRFWLRLSLSSSRSRSRSRSLRLRHRLSHWEGSQQTIKLKCLPQAKVTRHKSKLAVRQSHQKALKEHVDVDKNVDVDVVVPNKDLCSARGINRCNWQCTLHSIRGKLLGNWASYSTIKTS